MVFYGNESRNVAFRIGVQVYQNGINRLIEFRWPRCSEMNQFILNRNCPLSDCYTML